MNLHNPLIRQKNKFFKANKKILESEIDSRETAANTGRKTRQSGIPEEVYKNWETLCGKRSASDTYVIICSG